MRTRNAGKKLIVSVAVVVLIIGLGFFLWNETEKDKKQSEYQAEIDDKIRPLNVKKYHLTKELEDLVEAYEAKRKPKATTQIIFTELDPQVFDICYPIMKEKGFTGVLALSQTEFPGVQDCMTLEQFQKLQKEGWTTCVTWNSEKPVNKWWPALQNGIRQTEIEMPKAVYFPSGTYKASLDEEIKQAGFNIVVHHEEAGRSLIQSEYEEELWHLGAIGLMGGGTKTKFDDAIKAMGNIVYLVGFNRTDEMYNERSFVIMLGYFQSNVEDSNLIVGSMEDARRHYHSRLQEVSAEEERVYLEKKAELETQLADINTKLKELQSR